MRGKKGAFRGAGYHPRDIHGPIPMPRLPCYRKEQNVDGFNAKLRTLQISGYTVSFLRKGPRTFLKTLMVFPHCEKNIHYKFTVIKLACFSSEK